MATELKMDWFVCTLPADKREAGVPARVVMSKIGERYLKWQIIGALGLGASEGTLTPDVQVEPLDPDKPAHLTFAVEARSMEISFRALFTIATKSGTDPAYALRAGGLPGEIADHLIERFGVAPAKPKHELDDTLDAVKGATEDDFMAAIKSWSAAQS